MWSLRMWDKLGVAIVLAAVLGASITAAQAFDDSKYPNFKGPRAFDSSGIPLAADNATIVKERIYLDAADRDVFHDDVTVLDHALTRPWTVAKRYHREADAQPYWREVSCTENNNHVEIGKQAYMLSADGFLMPTKKDQPAPDLRYFKPVGR